MVIARPSGLYRMAPASSQVEKEGLKDDCIYPGNFDGSS